jgi:hypothetical protein
MCLGVLQPTTLLWVKGVAGAGEVRSITLSWLLALLQPLVKGG